MTDDTAKVSLAVSALVRHGHGVPIVAHFAEEFTSGVERGDIHLTGSELHVFFTKVFDAGVLLGQAHTPEQVIHLFHQRIEDVDKGTICGEDRG